MSASGDEPLDCPGSYTEIDLDEGYVQIRLEGDYCTEEYIEWNSTPKTLEELGWTDHVQATGYLDDSEGGEGV